MEEIRAGRFRLGINQFVKRMFLYQQLLTCILSAIFTIKNKLLIYRYKNFNNLILKKCFALGAADCTIVGQIVVKNIQNG